MPANNNDKAVKILLQRQSIKNYALSSTEKLITTRTYCKEDIFYWLENFCYTYDPRPDSLKNIPFIPYAFQVDLIKDIVLAVREGKDLLIEKSRDMGVTWCILYVFQWYWQFHQGFNFHLGSKKQDNVDKIGDPSTLFGKLRYNTGIQPPWLLPDNFSMKNNFHHLKMINPITGNTITGESSNPEFSRSGRYSAILYDEFAFWDYDEQAWSAGGDSSPCRIAVSTPYGKTNKFADLRFNNDIQRITLHWQLHPHKTSEWYEKEKNRRTSDELARELDINYNLSVEGKVYKEFDYATHVRDEIKPIQGLPVIRTWDFGLNPAVVFSQIDSNKRWLVLDEIVPDLNVKPTISEFIPQIIEYSKKNFSGCTFKDICDIAGTHRSSHSGKTDIDWLLSFGIVPLYNFVKIEEGINLVASRLIQKNQDSEQAFLISKKCKKTIEAFQGGYRRKKSSVSGVETEPEQVHPYEDVMDCIRYTAWQYFDARPEKKYRRKRSLHRPDNSITGY